MVTIDTLYSLGLSFGMVVCFALGYLGGKDLM
jgi:hypothetical protein